MTRDAIAVAAIAVAVSAACLDVHADALSELVPMPVKVERRAGAAAASALASAKVVRGEVPGAPARTADEAYVLEVSPAGVTIMASGERGARHARTTAAQLAKLAAGGPVPACRITDWPRFPLRGLMLDCGRNYQSLASIRDILDHMAAYKLNLFHWHLTDVHGWRLESKRHPELQGDAAFSRNRGRFYTQEEFNGVVAYASRLGITVVPELDVPGHTDAFRRAFSLEKMDSPGVDEIVCDLVDELCSLVPADAMPYVHLGTDEVRSGSERVPAAWYMKWANRVAANGRTLLGWSPGHALDGAKGAYVREAWGWTPAPVDGARPYLDSTGMYYVNHVDPLELLSAACYQQPCRFGSDESCKLGAMISAWHDDALASPDSLAREVAIYPAVVMLSDSFWCGREKDAVQYYGRLPSPDDPLFLLATDLERRVIAQRDKVLAGLKHPFPFVAQTHLRWTMKDASGKTVRSPIAHATVYPWHFRFYRSWYVNAHEGTVTLETWVKSPLEQEIGAWIGFTAYSRSSGRAAEGGTPASGEWSRHGASVSVNGEKVPPPEWRRPALSPEGISEIPLSDEEYYLREPTRIRLRKGWNHVVLAIPKHLPKTWKWVGTFIPVAGTSERPREVVGLEYSATEPKDAPADNSLEGVLDASVYARLPYSPAFAASVFAANVAAADRAADAAWKSVRTGAECEARRAELRAKAISAMGGFPERTPLNSKVVQTIRRDGYSVDKVLLESRPGVFVTGLFFRPDDTKFRPPFPAVLVACGHDGALGKLNPGYQRGCVLAAKSGISAFIYDPIEQGERKQVPHRTHDDIGVRLFLAGKSMAAVRIHDGIRAMDYVVSRPDVDAARIGFMGNSGGGTLSAYLTAFDPRVKAGAPSCFLSSIRAVVDAMGPQDAEQNVPGSLVFGLNHAGLVLLGGNAVCANFSSSDFFPIEGSRSTFEVVRGVASRIGAEERYAMLEVPGPHGWKESARVGSVQWMRRWLKGESSALPLDVPALRALDKGFDVAAADHGLEPDEGLVAPGGRIENLPGFRSYFDLMKQELAEAYAARRPLSAAERDSLATRLAAVEANVVVDVHEVERGDLPDCAFSRIVVERSDGICTPAVLFEPKGVGRAGAAILVGDSGRIALAPEVRRMVGEGRAVLVADLTGFGEASASRRIWYASRTCPTAALGTMLHLLGRSLVGHRAGQIVGLADFLRSRFGTTPGLVAFGQAAIPAAHAVAAGRARFSSVAVKNAPPSWRAAYEDPVAIRNYSFADVVHGALPAYDWPDLVDVHAE